MIKEQPKIIVMISPDGQRVEAEAFGLESPTCLKHMEPLNTLGKDSDVTKKPEFNKQTNAVKIHS